MKARISEAIWAIRFAAHLRRATGMPWRQCLSMARSSVAFMGHEDPHEAVRDEIHYAGGDLG